MLSFDQAIQRLNVFSAPDFDDCRGTLCGYLLKLKVIAVARELDLDKDERMKTLVTVFDVDAYCQTAIEIISESIGVDSFMFEEQILNAEGDELYIPINPLGGNGLTEDELYETASNPEWGRDLELLIFLAYIDHFFEEWAWETMSDHYGGWPEYPAEIFSALVGSRRGHIDFDALEEALQERGMACFMDALRVAWGLDDNPYFLVNYEYDAIDPLEFSTENVRMLQAEFQAARETLEGYHQAQEMLERDRSVLLDFLHTLQASIRLDEVRVRV